MAKKSGRSSARARRGAAAGPASRTAATAAPAPVAAAVRRPSLGEDPRRVIYAVIDLMFTLGYVIAFDVLVPNRHGWAELVLHVLPTCTALMGVAALVGTRFSWWVTVVAASTMLVWAVGFMIVLVRTASYLAGVYGAFGKAAATGSLLATAFVIQFAATLPALQLKWALTRAGRRAFGLAPVWPRRRVARA